MSETDFDFPMDEAPSTAAEPEMTALRLRQAVAETVMGKGEDARPTIDYLHKKLWVKAPNDPRYPGADIWKMPDGSLWAEESLEPDHEVRRFHKVD